MKRMKKLDITFYDKEKRQIGRYCAKSIDEALELLKRDGANQLAKHYTEVDIMDAKYPQLQELNK